MSLILSQIFDVLVNSFAFTSLIKIDFWYTLWIDGRIDIIDKFADY
jgi:hypothetical protein